MKKMFDLSDKVALVVGGHGGIGKAIALGLADAGADVAVASRNLEDLKAAARDIESRSRKSLAVTVDIVDEKQVNGMVTTILETFPRIDILVNAAGLAIRKPADSFPVDEWQKVMDINTRGTFLCSQAAGREMIRRQSGKIINIASINGIAAFPERASYCSAKAGVIALTKVLAVEWARHGINVNAIALGYVDTELVRNLASQGTLDVDELVNRTPSKKLTGTADVGKAAFFLASEDARNINGQTLVIDGGWTAYGYLESWLKK